MNRAVRLLIAGMILGLGSCAEPPTRADSPGIRASASGVTLEIGRGEGRIVASGRRLELAQGNDRFELRGDATLEARGESPWSARADRISVTRPGPRVVLEGGVKATFTLPGEETGDAAP